MMDKRVHAVLNSIVNHPAITSAELAASFNLSRKQLSYTLQKINDYLTTKQFMPITRLRTGKFKVPKTVRETFQQDNKLTALSRYVYTDDERLYLINFLLLTRVERLSLLHLSSALTVSQNTIINDMKKVKSLNQRFRIDLSYDREHGYHLQGAEIGKRQLLLLSVRKILAMPLASERLQQFSTLSENELQRVGQLFCEIERERKIIFTDAQLQELTYSISFILQRIVQQKLIRRLPSHYAQAVESQDFVLMRQLIEKLGITQRNEQIFLTVLVQSSNIQTIADKYFQLDTLLLNSVIEVVDNFEQLGCINFKDKDELIERIYQHWKPAYYRIRYHLVNVNSVYELVRQEFGHLHEMVRRAITPFKKLLHCTIPDEEIAFLTVLFGGWLTREGIMEQLQTKKIALVVCENSATVSTYLYLTLQALLPELHFAAVISRREFEKYARYYDIVFSTCHLQTDKLLFIINPAFNHHHKMAFRNQVIRTLQGIDPGIIQVDDLIDIIAEHGQIHNRYALQKALTHYLYTDDQQKQQQLQNKVPSLADLLTLSQLQIQVQPITDWHQAITVAAAPLLQQDLITPAYIQAMLNKIEQTKPYIMLVKGLIIAHAGIDDGVKQPGMALLRLPKPLNIADYLQADIIIVLATNNPQRHLKALAQLNEFLELNDGATQIRQAQSTTEIRQLIAVYR